MFITTRNATLDKQDIVREAVRTGPTSSKMTEYRPHGLKVVSDQRAKWVGVVTNAVFIQVIWRVA
jgi:hypothetical protein